MINRRGFLKGVGMVAGAAWTGGPSVQGAEKEDAAVLHLATNQYPWGTFYGREKRNFEQSLDAGLGEVAAAGLNGFEPIANSPQQVAALAPLLKKHGLEMRSLYVNSTLHTVPEAAKSIDHLVAVAAEAKALGARIIVTNPNPIRWGGPESKDDDQLETQAAALNTLGQKLTGMDMVLAYHYHEPELRHAGREFHHMMVGTDPKLVTLCFDAHWMFRGAGNSAVAVYDAVKLYGPRITELHARQSVKGIWTEAFGDGDIDYAKVVRLLLAAGVKPLLVLEQAVEGATPNTMSAVEAHRKGVEYARRVFAEFAK